MSGQSLKPGIVCFPTDSSFLDREGACGGALFSSPVTTRSQHTITHVSVVTGGRGGAVADPPRVIWSSHLAWRECPGQRFEIFWGRNCRT